MKTSDPFDLERFVKAQDLSYGNVISELTAAKKTTHWMWFIFPQLAGLGSSSKAREFAIKSTEEAIAYLKHPVLGRRLCQCIEIVLMHNQKRIEEIFGWPDYLKFKSCLTLFYLVSLDQEIFKRALDQFFGSKLDENTRVLLGNSES